MIKTCIFDLDGTLTDTLEDLADAGNQAIAKRGYPTHPIESYKLFIGNGIGKLVERIVPPELKDEAEIAAIGKDLVGYYKEHLLDKTRPYPGIMDLLETLQARGMNLFIVTNKPNEQANVIAKALFSNIGFREVIGNSDRFRIKPDPESALYCAGLALSLPSECLYTGDSNVDMETGNNAGMHTVGVTWGFRSREELNEYGAHYLVDEAKEILGIIDGING